MSVDHQGKRKEVARERADEMLTEKLMCREKERSFTSQEKNEVFIEEWWPEADIEGCKMATRFLGEGMYLSQGGRLLG